MKTITLSITALVLLAVGIVWWDIRHQRPSYGAFINFQVEPSKWYWVTRKGDDIRLYDTNFNLIAHQP